MDNKLFGIVLVVALVVGIAGISAGTAWIVSLQLPKPQVEYPQLGAAGDTASTSKVAIIAMQTASSTLCTLYNFGTRNRWILNAWARVNVASSTNLARLVVATSSSAARSLANTAGGYFLNRSWPATSASSSYADSATTSASLADGLYWKNIWPTGTYLNFYGSSSVDFGGDGLCGVDYATDN